MLNIDEAISAIEYFFNKVENLQIGNPLPFCESYNADNEGEQSFKHFNELMFPEGSNPDKIFYGEITYSTAKVGSNTLECFISKQLDFSNKFCSIRLRDLGSVNSSLLLTSKPVLIQELSMENDCIITMNGYLFALAIVKP